MSAQQGCAMHCNTCSIIAGIHVELELFFWQFHAQSMVNDAYVRCTACSMTLLVEFASLDGTLTLAACMCHQVISFNLGSMGFLTNHSYKNYAEDIMGVINGDQDLGHCAMDQEVSTGPPHHHILQYDSTCLASMSEPHSATSLATDIVARAKILLCTGVSFLCFTGFRSRVHIKVIHAPAICYLHRTRSLIIVRHEKYMLL